MKFYWLFIISILFLSAALAAQDCPILSDAKKSALVEYVRKEYKLKEDTSLKLSKDELVHDTCYREITFEGKSPLKNWQIAMYLSPDQRFLTGELFDTTTDPIEEQRRRTAALMSGLIQNKGASKGPDYAPVTIVEFSDFQCPFCRRFAALLDQVLPEENNHVRVVFHHMPLSTHPWARAAAEGAACAQLQGSEHFWKMHDQIFDNQATITPDNVKSKVEEFARSTHGLNLTDFENCLQSEMSLGLVLRDLDLASANSVDATPTLFINGNRIAGVKDAAQLRQLIAEAEMETSHISAPQNARAGK